MGQNSAKEAKDQIMKNLVSYIKDPKYDEKPLEVLSRQVTKSDTCFEKTVPTAD